MKKYSFLILLATILFALSSHGMPCVVSGCDGHPIVYAHVYDNEGHLIGLTDMNGQLPSECYKGQAILIYQPAYYPIETNIGNVEKIEMRPAGVYPLPQETSTEGKSHLWIRTYWRSYVVSDEGIAYIEDGVNDCFFSLSNKKVSESEIWLRSMQPSDPTDGEKKLSFMTVANGAASALSPYESLSKMTTEEKQEFVIKGFASITEDTIAGISEMHVDGTKMLLNHSIPLLFTGMSIKEMKISETFAFRPTFSLWDILVRQSSLSISYKNKVTKEKKKARLINEVFYLERAYVSKEEMKEIKKGAEKEVPANTVPKGVAPLPKQLAKKVEGFV